MGGQQGLGSSIITTDSLEVAVENAVNQGVYVIAAAGNDGENDDKGQSHGYDATAILPRHIGSSRTLLVAVAIFFHDWICARPK